MNSGGATGPTDEELARIGDALVEGVDLDLPSDHDGFELLYAFFAANPDVDFASGDVDPAALALPDDEAAQDRIGTLLRRHDDVTALARVATADDPEAAVRAIAEERGAIEGDDEPGGTPGDGGTGSTHRGGAAAGSGSDRPPEAATPAADAAQARDPTDAGGAADPADDGADAAGTGGRTPPGAFIFREDVPLLRWLDEERLDFESLGTPGIRVAFLLGIGVTVVGSLVAMDASLTLSSGGGPVPSVAFERPSLARVALPVAVLSFPLALAAGFVYPGYADSPDAEYPSEMTMVVAVVPSLAQCIAYVVFMLGSVAWWTIEALLAGKVVGAALMVVVFGAIFGLLAALVARTKVGRALAMLFPVVLAVPTAFLLAVPVYGGTRLGGAVGKRVWD